MLKTHFPLSTQGLYFTTKLKDNIWLILKEYLSHLIRFSYCEIWKALADKVFVSRLGGSWRLQFPCKLLSRLNSTIILTTVPKKTIHWWKSKLFSRVFALFLVVVLTLLLFFPILFSVGIPAEKSQEKCSRPSGKHPLQRPVHLPKIAILPITTDWAKLTFAKLTLEENDSWL